MLPVHGPVLTQSFSEHVSARALRSWCSSCTAPGLSADFFKGGRKIPDVDIGRERVCNRAVLWTDCERRVALVDVQHTLPHVLQVAHKLSCSWSCAGPLVARTSVDNPLSTCAFTPYNSQLAQLLHGSRSISRSFSKGMEDSRCGHRLRECV